MKYLHPLLAVLLAVVTAQGPPMGWSTGFRYNCVTKCEIPGECLDESLVKSMADELVSGGFKGVGYEYIILDDCWAEMKRDEQMRLVPDRKRFPNGLKGVIDYVHSKGLKFGLYLNFGQQSPNGYPGSLFDLDIDAKTMNDWEVDYVKVDAYDSDPKQQSVGLMTFANYLRFGKRPIHIMCEYPVYQDWDKAGEKYDFTTVTKSCDSFRITKNVTDSFSSVKNINNFIVKNNAVLVKKQEKPNTHWYDADYLMIGNTGLSKTQSLLQMMLWSMWQSPLIMSNDLKSLTKFDKEVLQNMDLIKINQDVNGAMPQVDNSQRNIQIWKKELASGESVVLLTNYNGLGSQINMTESVTSLLKVKKGAFNIKDVITGEEMKGMKASDQFSVVVTLSTGKMYKITPV